MIKPLAHMILLLLILNGSSYGQRYEIVDGTLSFEAAALIDTVTAYSTLLTGSLDAQTMEVRFFMPIKSLLFENELILTNLSKEIVDIRRHPEIRFTGRIDQKSFSQLDEKGVTNVSGVLFFNGVEQKLLTEINYVRTKDQLEISLTTTIDLNDHDITIPSILRDALSHEVDISLKMTMK